MHVSAQNERKEEINSVCNGAVATEDQAERPNLKIEPCNSPFAQIERFRVNVIAVAPKTAHHECDLAFREELLLLDLAVREIDKGKVAADANEDSENAFYLTTESDSG